MSASANDIGDLSQRGDKFTACAFKLFAADAPMMPSQLAFHEAHAFALNRVGDHDEGFSGTPPLLGTQGGKQLIKRMAVDLGNLPAKGLPFAIHRRETIHVLGKIIDDLFVAIDDRDNIVELV